MRTVRGEAPSFTAHGIFLSPLTSHFSPFPFSQLGLPEPESSGSPSFIRLFQRLLFGQPFFPILRELVHVVLGDGNQFCLHESGRRIFVFRDLVVQHVD